MTIIEWTWPEWLTFGYSADVVTWLGFGLTCWIGWQARTIRDYFFNRVRVGEILPELSTDSQALIKALGEWEKTGGTGKATHNALSRVRGRLINLKGKLVSEEKKSLKLVLGKIEHKRYWFFSRDISEISLDEAWEIARALDGMIVQVDGGHKDSSWRSR
ncbi:hypothetical protein [Pseudomonas fulva]|uniref:hypothetical protein n=1 Tax=Pseudomonas fulva TaxID=47880 RepID=UPI0038300B62